MDVNVDPGEAAELGGPFHAGALRQAGDGGMLPRIAGRWQAVPDACGGAGAFLELVRASAEEGPLSELRQTPLHALHVGLGARMVPFAGYDMPVQYPAGILKEHLHTRGGGGPFRRQPHGADRRCGRGRAISPTRRAALEALVPVDVLGLAPGRQRYALLHRRRRRHPRRPDGREPRRPPAAGGQRRLQGRRTSRISRRRSAASCAVEPLDRGADRAAGAEGGGGAGGAEPGRGGRCGSWTCGRSTSRGIAAVVSRSGYTGEDGFEISLARAGRGDAGASGCWRCEGVLPIGLGARDSLRLEAGLCLYGHDIDRTTTPVEAALEWAIQPARRAGGARAGRLSRARR